MIYMTKLIELEKEKYENFQKNNSKSHFLQSYYWGEFSKEKKNLTPYYLGLVDDNEKILGTCLLLEKKLPFSYSYFYSPRGFVIDYSNDELIRDMTNKVIDFIKTKKSIFLKIDPDIVRKAYNYNDEEKVLDLDPDKVFKTLTSIGFKHLGFTKNFETMQPRYTFRIDMKNQDLDEIYEHFSKTTKQRIKKAIKLGTDVRIGDINDIDIFYELMMLTENRKDFVSYDKDYYKKQYEILSRNDMAKLFLGSINTTKIISNLNEEIKSLEEQKKEIGEATGKNAKNKLKEIENNIERINKEVEKYKEAKEKYGEIITLNAHMLITYDKKSWVLYAGNHNILTESYANYNTYYEHIKYAYENGIKVYDQFGTIGDLSKDNPRLGLHEFKKKFGGDYVEFLGEFDYITNHFMYFVFTKLVPLYRKLIRNRSKKEISNEVKRYK